MLIDLVAVEYAAGREICIAPWQKVSVGDTVETNFGTATVVATNTISTGDTMFKFMNENSPITRVRSLYLDYEEESNDLSERRDD